MDELDAADRLFFTDSEFRWFDNLVKEGATLIPGQGLGTPPYTEVTNVKAPLGDGVTFGDFEFGGGSQYIVPGP